MISASKNAKNGRISSSNWTLKEEEELGEDGEGKMERGNKKREKWRKDGKEREGERLETENGWKEEEKGEGRRREKGEGRRREKGEGRKEREERNGGGRTERSSP